MPELCSTASLLPLNPALSAWLPIPAYHSSLQGISTPEAPPPVWRRRHVASDAPCGLGKGQLAVPSHSAPVRKSPITDRKREKGGWKRCRRRGFMSRNASLSSIHPPIPPPSSPSIFPFRVTSVRTGWNARKHPSHVDICAHNLLKNI